jgi:hypothetical protein
MYSGLLNVFQSTVVLATSDFLVIIYCCQHCLTTSVLFFFFTRETSVFFSTLLLEGALNLELLMFYRDSISIPCQLWRIACVVSCVIFACAVVSTRADDY